MDGGDPGAGTRRVRRCAAALVLTGALSAVALPAAASSAGRAAAISPVDEAATNAYLTAYRAYQQAAKPSLPAFLAAAQAEAAKVAAECPGVLNGSPVRREFGGPLEESSGPPLTPRQTGERARAQRQLQGLLVELNLVVADSGSAMPALSAARATFIAAVRPLRWSKAATTAGVQRYVDRIEAQARAPSLDVCADMRAWAAGGYTSLPAPTRGLLTALPFQISSSAPVIRPQSFSLRVYEGPAEHALLLAIRAEQRADLSSQKAIAAAAEAAGRALGLLPEPELERATGQNRPKVVLARGRTASGERFTAVLENGAGGGSGCPAAVSIERGRGSDSLCGARSGEPPNPSVNCDAGVLTITSSALPRTRRVRLRLSNGRTVTSPVIRVPKHDGGPAGWYYQAVRGPSPIPVSLSELDRHGHVLRTVRLPAIVECTKNPLKYLSGGPHMLARVKVPPNGPTYALVAEHYRFLGKTYTDVKAEQVSQGSGSLFEASSASGETFGFQGRERAAARLFTPEEQSGCEPVPYAFVYGTLTAPGDTVLARTPKGLQQLSKVPLPHSFGVHEAVVYGVLEPPPDAIVIRAPGGRTIGTENIPGSRAVVEQCEGEAEPVTPAPVQPAG